MTGGEWSWTKARNSYYEGLTASDKGAREGKLADTFFSLGHIMHLVADSSVPAHTRNDIHVFPIEIFGSTAGQRQTYESWAKKQPPGVLNYAAGKVDQTIFKSSVPNPSAPVPISALWDQDVYKGTNPEDTWTTGSAISRVGLAEYTNANYFSEDTIFTTDYPHPRKENTTAKLVEQYARDGTLDKVWYIMGYQTERLAALSYFWDAGLSGRWIYQLDNFVYESYAQNLIPRAVGYSAGLLNYFFRGDIRLEYTTSPAPGYVITNKTNEDTDGSFQIFYDTKDGERAEYMSGTFGLKANTKGAVFDMSPPSNAMEPGKYILVFKGKMGNEDGAVAGYVYSEKILEVTAPAEFVYGIIDGGVEPQQFTTLKARVRNTSGQAIGPGTLRAVASYRKRTDYQPDLSAEPPTFDGRAPEVSVSVSALHSIASLSSTDAVQYSFDFTADPIPAGVTDLYLDIIFEGQVGDSPQGMIAGRKDLNEPHHLAMHNLTDRYEVDHVLYTAEEILADREKFYYLINQTWGHMNFYPHPMTMTLYFSGNKTVFPYPAAVIQDLPAARYGRIIFLVDEPGTFYLLHMLTADNTTTFYNDSITGVVNQFDSTTWTTTEAVQYRGSWSHDYLGYWGCYPYPVWNVCTGGEWPTPDDLTPYPVQIIGP
jgi:hypothetical protein